MNANAPSATPAPVRAAPLSTLLAAREEDVRAAITDGRRPAGSGVWRTRDGAPAEPPPVDVVRLESLPYVRFTATALAPLLAAIDLPGLEDVTGNQVLAVANATRGAELPSDLHVIERVSDLVRDGLARTEPDQVRAELEAERTTRDATRHLPLDAILRLARHAREARMPLWLWSVHRADGSVPR